MLYRYILYQKKKNLTWIVEALVEAYSNNAIPQFGHKEVFLNRQVFVWEGLISPSKVITLKKKSLGKY